MKIRKFNESTYSADKPNFYRLIEILEGENELKKSTKYGIVKVLMKYDDRPETSIQYMTPEKVKLQLKYQELIDKGWNRKELDEILDLQKKLLWRENRDSEID